MSACRYDREVDDYLIDGEPCRRDDYGDPTRHCTARRTCSEHIGPGELTCARCIGRTRTDIRVIRDRAAEVYPTALFAGVNSEAANLAGPAADPQVFEARRALGREWIYANIQQSARGWCDDPACQRRHFKTSTGDRWHKRGIENALADLLEDDDEHHPYTVLTRWQMMLAEDYQHPTEPTLSIHGAAAYLERVLPRLAHDDQQDFPLFAREIRKCRTHLENVLQDGTAPERGAPCPDCREKGHIARMVREYPHWCEDPDCERFHYSVMVDLDTRELVPDTTGDWWICPRDHDHDRPHAVYEEWIEARVKARHNEAS